MTQNLKATTKRNGFGSHLWNGIFLIVLGIGACATAPQPPQNEPLPPPENATPQVSQLLLDGNRLFAEHRWTAAMMKYEEAIQAQPTLAEAHYNLGMVLYKRGPVLAASPFFYQSSRFASRSSPHLERSPVQKIGHG